jgi:hypothetical protein
LLTQLQKARLGQEADTTGSVRFEVIEPPNADFKSVPPSRSQLIAAVLVLALGAGAGLAYLRDRLNPVFWSPITLAVVTGVGVLGVVTSAFPEALDRTSRRNLVWYSAAVASLVAVAIVLLRASQLGLSFVPPGVGLGRG